MAEKAAHFSFTTEAKPSIFEIIAQNSLDATLQPALRKVAEFLSIGPSRYLRWFNDNYDEAFLILNALLQYYYLRNYNASFSEHFYGLQRRSLQQGINFTDGQRRLSLAALVLLPYVQLKINEKLSALRLQKAEEGFRKNFNGFFKELLLRVWSVSKFTWGMWTLLNYMRYMSDGTESQLPSLRVLNMKLAYAEQPENIAAFWSALLKGRLNFTEASTGLLRNGLRTSLEVAAFFVQFLHVWNGEKSSYNVTALPTVPAPELDHDAGKYKGKCPICLQNWKIPTALPVSGYVFCFPCILKYLRENQRCPVTDLPAKPLDVVRLYDT